LFQVRVVLDETPRRVRVALHEVYKRTWEDWWNEVRVGLDAPDLGMVSADLPHRHANASSGSLICDPPDSWSAGALDDSPWPRTNHAAVWTGSEMLIWGGRAGVDPVTQGARYDP
jgi:hypothetical protein